MALPAVSGPPNTVGERDAVGVAFGQAFSLDFLLLA